MRQKRREYYDIPEAFNEIISKIYNLKTRSDNFPTASRKKCIKKMDIKRKKGNNHKK